MESDKILSERKVFLDLLIVVNIGFIRLGIRDFFCFGSTYGTRCDGLGFDIVGNFLIFSGSALIFVWGLER